MNNPKTYLCFMATEGDYQNIVELVEPVKQYFNGVCALLHDCDFIDKESEYLIKVNNDSGGGNILFGSYRGRHDHSRNRILYETCIKEGDFLVQIDTLERVAVEFAANALLYLTKWMVDKNIDVCYYFGKPYVIRFREDMRYHGNPHESLVGDRHLNCVELNRQFKDESKVRINVRPIKRIDPYHWVGHYAKYYFLPNSNQCLLGLDHRPKDSFERRQNLREEVKRYLLANGHDFSLDSFVSLYQSKPMDESMKKFLSEEKILQDIIRYKVWGERDLADDHSWKDIKNYE